MNTTQHTRTHTHKHTHTHTRTSLRFDMLVFTSNLSPLSLQMFYGSCQHIINTSNVTQLREILRLRLPPLISRINPETADIFHTLDGNYLSFKHIKFVYCKFPNNSKRSLQSCVLFITQQSFNDINHILKRCY
jgi:hypothetical protein